MVGAAAADWALPAASFATVASYTAIITKGSYTTTECAVVVCSGSVVAAVAIIVAGTEC